jgi:hypothetical protein
MRQQQQQVALPERGLGSGVSQARARALHRQQAWDRLVWSCVLLCGQWAAGVSVLLALLSGALGLFLLALGILAPLGVVWSLAGIAGVVGLAPGGRPQIVVWLSSVLAFLVNVGLVIWASRIEIDL